MLGEIWGEILTLARLTPALWWPKWQAQQGQDSPAAARSGSWTLALQRNTEMPTTAKGHNRARLLAGPQVNNYTGPF